MAEASAAAFGRYLRWLRERRGLSLQDVAELTKNCPEAIDKGTLSRLERGQQVPSIFKLGPLSRIYDVSPEVLIERMELDREVERVAHAKTAGKDYDELLRLGADALIHDSRKWEAYAYFREALELAPADKRTSAWGNLVTAIRTLGKNRLALHELAELEASGNLTPPQRALVHERISNCHRCLGDMKAAEAYADSAARQAVGVGDSRILAFAYQTRANAALDQEQWDVASDYLMRGLGAYRESADQECLLLPNPAFEAETLYMLADCAIHLANLARARRLALAAKRMCQERGLPRGLAYSELMLGRIDVEDGAAARAAERWRRAAALAERTGNRRLAFTVELEIYRHAVQQGDSARARASRRKLERLAPWVPRHIPAYREFKERIKANRPQLERAAEGGIHEDVPGTEDVHDRGGARRAPGAVGAAAARPKRTRPGSVSDAPSV